MQVFDVIYGPDLRPVTIVNISIDHLMSKNWSAQINAYIINIIKSSLAVLEVQVQERVISNYFLNYLLIHTIRTFLTNLLFKTLNCIYLKKTFLWNWLYPRPFHQVGQLKPSFWCSPELHDLLVETALVYITALLEQSLPLMSHAGYFAIKSILLLKGSVGYV